MAKMDCATTVQRTITNQMTNSTKNGTMTWTTTNGTTDMIAYPDDMAKCPECDARFDVVFLRSHDLPEYCPFCGCEMQYDTYEHTEDDD
jgi:uncharacterized paraquat-inducible protein A